MKENVSLSIPKLKAEITELRARADKLEELLELAVSRGEEEPTEAVSMEPRSAVARRGRPPVTVPRKNLFGQPIPPYQNMGTKQAAIAYLKRKGSPAGATEIALALKEGGQQSRSTQLNRTVDNTLSVESKKKNPLVEKIDGEWALTEWRRST